MYLVEKGADINAADPFHKRTPLFAAVERRNPGLHARHAPPVPDAP